MRGGASLGEPAVFRPQISHTCDCPDDEDGQESPNDLSAVVAKADDAQREEGAGNLAGR